MSDNNEVKEENNNENNNNENNNEINSNENNDNNNNENNNNESNNENNNENNNNNNEEIDPNDPNAMYSNMMSMQQLTAEQMQQMQQYQAYYGMYPQAAAQYYQQPQQQQQQQQQQSSGDNSDNLNVFCNYLPPQYRDQELLRLFQPYGNVVSCKVMIDFATLQSRCYGFVQFSSSQEAQQAIAALHGLKIENKTLTVRLANPTSNPSKNKGTPSNNVYCKNIPYNFTHEALCQLFQPYGTIEEAKVIIDLQTGYGKGIAFVRFGTVDQAEAAIDDLNGYLIPGAPKPLMVKFSDTAEEKQERKLRQQRSYERYNPYRSMSQAGYTSNYQQLTALSQNPAYNQYYQGYNTTGAGATAASVNAAAYQQAASAATYGQTGTGSGTGDERNLFIYHLPEDMNDATLYQLFTSFGAIESAKAIVDPTTGKCKGYGFVKMVNLQDAFKAVQSMNGYQVGNKYLKVSFKK
eukprot:TRINITY_DN2936_c0_g3_i1.p1 TRINITY_DN2936_c0_g3~~TRINITY_DN2936_c0_g3_i1.p1  ORF type:complete len:464 (-),score=205.27 TRINITY_DN2936_c0_g3_i1:176-1567(-)